MQKLLLILSLLALCLSDWNKILDADINFPANTYVVQCDSNCTITGQIQFYQNVQYSLTIYDSSLPMFNNVIASFNNTGGLSLWNFYYTVTVNGNYYVKVHDISVQ